MRCHTGTPTYAPKARRGIICTHEAPVSTSVFVDRRSTGASPSIDPATPGCRSPTQASPRRHPSPAATLIFPALGLTLVVLNLDVDAEGAGVLAWTVFG